MPDIARYKLAETVELVLQESAFLFALHLGGDNDRPGAGASAMTSATVEFSGTHRGHLTIRFPDALMPTLAANMLGADAAPSETLQRDALGEIANVVCGHLVPSIWADAAVRLSPPVIGASERAERPVASISAAQAFDVDGYLVEAVIELDTSPQSPAST